MIGAVSSQSPYLVAHKLPEGAIVHFDFSSAQWQQDCAHLPPEVLKAAAQFRPYRKQSYLAGRWLLSQLMRHYYDKPELPEIIYNENGRPFFKDAELPIFSISHSAYHLFIVLGIPGKAVGIDIEVARVLPQAQALAQHRFSTEEYHYLMDLAPALQPYFFLRLWTLREAMLKLYGLGIGAMNAFHIAPKTQTLITPKGYGLSFCYHQCIGALTLLEPFGTPLIFEFTYSKGKRCLHPRVLAHTLTFTPESVPALG